MNLKNPIKNFEFKKKSYLPIILTVLSYPAEALASKDLQIIASKLEGTN